MKVLVAGGAGFIGSHLCKRLLDDNYHVICVDTFITSSSRNIAPIISHKNFTLLEHDVIKPLPTTIKADYVFHLASPASPNHHSPISYHALPMETMLVNTTGTLNLLRFSKVNNASFLFASTSEIYGDPLEHPQKETYRGNTSTTGPRSVYDEAKRFGETLTAHFWREEGVDARIARIFNTFGPNMAPQDKRMIVSFITQALEGKPLPVFGDGSQTRSLCYVDDMVEGLMKLMFKEKTSGEVVNIGSAEEHTVKEYAKMILHMTNSSSKIECSEELPEDDPKVRKPDIRKAKKLLGWEPQVSLEEGIKHTITYFQSL